MPPFALLALAGLALLALSKKTTAAAAGTLAAIPQLSMTPAVGLTVLPFVVPVGTMLVVNPPAGSTGFACIIVGPTGAAATSASLQPAPLALAGGALGFVGSAAGTASLLAAWTIAATGVAQQTTFSVTVQ
jgi:hypothetical protein